MQHIYLDYNATTPIAPSVVEAMLPFLNEHFGNPSSGHALGRACHEAIEDARYQVASALGVDREEIVFTSGGTEANNLALKGVLLGQPPSVGGHLIISSLEHPAIVEPARFLERWGYDLSVVPCDSRGLVDPDEVARAIRPDTRLVSIMHANNEIGVIEPIREIAAVCRSHNVLVHTDAAQTLGKIRVAAAELDVDLLTIAGHKLYAAKGVGALYVRSGVHLEPVLHGAGHERGLRPGTENTASIVGLGKACEMAAKAAPEGQAQLGRLRDRLYELLCEGVGAPLKINGEGAPRLPNTLSVVFPGVNAGSMLARASEICASTGAACHSGSSSRTATLAAIGLSEEEARGAMRLSCGWSTSIDEIERAASLLIEAWEALR